MQQKPLHKDSGMEEWEARALDRNRQNPNAIPLTGETLRAQTLLADETIEAILREEMKPVPHAEFPSKVGDSVSYPGCGGVGKVLSLRTVLDEDDEAHREALVQWPDSAGEYVRPCWVSVTRLTRRDA